MNKNVLKGKRKPKWLSRKLPRGLKYQNVNHTVAENNLNTVCREANCPNQFECFSKGSATFMILGSQCTRTCRFCNIKSAENLPLDLEEPGRVAQAVKQMGLKYVVITSVTRDDLADGGASIFAETVRLIRENDRNVKIELLIPDLLGHEKSLQTVVDSGPEVLNHNMETIRRYYGIVRPEADYDRSLNLLRKAKELNPLLITKTGVMIGLGETKEELCNCFEDIVATGCNILTIGQYLQPSRNHFPMERYYTPDEFEQLKERAIASGFDAVASAPLVRSSYMAEECYLSARKKMSE